MNGHSTVILHPAFRVETIETCFYRCFSIRRVVLRSRKCKSNGQNIKKSKIKKKWILFSGVYTYMSVSRTKGVHVSVQYNIWPQQILEIVGTLQNERQILIGLKSERTRVVVCREIIIFNINWYTVLFVFEILIQKPNVKRFNGTLR